MAPKLPEEYRMSLGDHLDELRRRLMLGLAGPLVAVIVMFYFADRIIEFMLIPLQAALRGNGLPPTVYGNSPLSIFSLWTRVAMVGGIVVGVPWLLWHLWQFVAPGLYPKERKFVTRLIPGTAFCAVAGISFMYYVVLPRMMMFLIGITVTLVPPPTPPPLPLPPGVTLPSIPMLAADPQGAVNGQMWVNVAEHQLRVMIDGKVMGTTLTTASLIQPLIQADEYIKLVLFLALGFSIAFQLPLVMLGLAWSGIVTRKQMAGARRIMLLVNTILGAVLTGGADVTAMLFMAAALQVLYEVGLLLIRFKGPVESPETIDGEVIGGDNDTGP